MGFYTKYFSTLFKGVRMTALKERFEIRRLVNDLRKADHVLYKGLIEDVQQEHRVTKALKEEDRLITELKKSAENAYSLVFNLSTEEIALLKTVEDILKELELFSKSIGSNPQLVKLEREFALIILDALKKGESQQREESKRVMLIINEAEEKNRNKFMANVMLAFQQERQQTILAKFAARAEIRSIKVNIIKLKEVPLMIRSLRFGTKGKKPETVDKVIAELSRIIKIAKDYCNDAFRELFYIQKRVLLLTLKILLDLNNLRRFNQKWVEKHFMPREPVEKRESALNEAEQKISKDFHTIAQAFRIIISKTQSLEKAAKRA